MAHMGFTIIPLVASILLCVVVIRGGSSREVSFSSLQEDVLTRVNQQTSFFHSGINPKP